MTLMSEALTCSVCHEPLTPTTEAWCGECGESYHLNQRTDLPGKDCGSVWINEEHLALEFACNNCLHPVPAGLEDVLDLDEAAAYLRMGTPDLAGAAERGAVPHRKTSAGVYLFVRKDLDAFQR
jgi:hypothetical protein